MLRTNKELLFEERDNIINDVNKFIEWAQHGWLTQKEIKEKMAGFRQYLSVMQECALNIRKGEK